MAELPAALQDRENQKFLLDENDEVTVRTTGRGTFTQSGLQVEGLHTEVTINDSGWTPLPTMPLENRNAMSIQNVSGAEIKVNYRTDVGYVGMRIPNGNERYYDIKESIILYARAFPGAGAAVILDIEELA